MSGLSDGTLARQAATGDRAAFAALYDRFSGEIYGFNARLLSNPSDAADVTQDVFVRAIEKLPQLREPDRVRAWLFTIARHECFARTKRRSRSMATDPMDLATDMASTSRSTVGLVEANELTKLVWDAAKGLAPEDRAVLDLKLRRDLDGADLADALGVPHDQLHKVTGRAMERFERSVIALVLARGARKDCSVLAGLVESDDVELTPVLRKRIARHAQDCDFCERRRKMLVNPSTMVASAHETGPSAALRDRVLEASFNRALTGTSAVRSLSWRADGFPTVNPLRRRLVTTAVLAGVLLAIVFGSGVGSGSGEGDIPKQEVEIGSPSTKVATPTSISSAPATSSSPSTTAVAALRDQPSRSVTPAIALTFTTTLAVTSSSSSAPPPSTGAITITSASPRSLAVVPTTKAKPRPTVPTIPATTVAPTTVKVPVSQVRPSTPKRTQPPRVTTVKTSTSAARPIVTSPPPPSNTLSDPIASTANPAPESTQPPVIFPESVTVEIPRSTTLSSPTTAIPVTPSTTRGFVTTSTPATAAPIASTTATTSTTSTTPVLITSPAATTTTLKCALTQAGCATPPVVTTTSTTVFRLSPVCCLTVGNLGLFVVTTTQVPIK